MYEYGQFLVEMYTCHWKKSLRMEIRVFLFWYVEYPHQSNACTNIERQPLSGPNNVQI